MKNTSSFSGVVRSKYQAILEAEDAVGGGTVLACEKVPLGWLCKVRAKEGDMCVLVGYLATEVLTPL